MASTIVSYTNLSNDVKSAFRLWLEKKGRELISFPFHGKHMKGYVFNHEQNNYIVVMQLHSASSINTSMESAEKLDINEEI